MGDGSRSHMIMTSNRSILLLSMLPMILVAGGATLPSVAGPDSTRATLAHWQSNLTNRINQPRFRNAQWGIKVVSLDTGKTVFERNSRKYF